MNLPLRAAALTPLVPGGIAVVAMAGDGAIDVLRSVFRPASRSADRSRSSGTSSSPDPTASSDRLRFGQIVDGDAVLDDAVVALREDAAGRPFVELNVHGGPRIVQRVLLALESRGATIVAPDELAAATWPIDGLLDAEVYTLLPKAMTRRAAGWLLRQRELLPRAVAGICARLTTDRMAARDDIAVLAATYAPARRFFHGFSVAIVGAPNSGKSTLANALCGQPRVLVADAPGTTRDYVSEPIAIDGAAVTLIDTAGLRRTDDALESEGIARTWRQAAAADLRVIVVDASAPTDAELCAALARLADLGPCVTVLNKSDLPPAVWGDEMPSVVTDAGLRTSALHGDGLDALRRQMLKTAGIDADFASAPAIFTERQAALLRAALSEPAGAEAAVAAALHAMIGRVQEEGADPRG